ncbi:MAG: hypothetical protein M1828_001142 [Chrysothrix sp. TS-e1954]|nr:MAG: hypothetical protein M1828_001142 [Chrysothrix sp. TS-e1954]
MPRDPRIEEAYARIGSYASMLEPDQNIDRRHAKRTVPMQVLSLGMSRTGTLTMQRALEILGYPNPYHFSSMYGNILDSDMWVLSMQAKEKQYSYISSTYGASEPVTPARLDEASSVALTDAERGALSKGHFDALLGHCGAVTDSPCVHFHAELISQYPDSKIVLVERDPEKWIASLNTLKKGSRGWMAPILRKLDPGWYGRIYAVGFGFFSCLCRTKRGSVPTDEAAVAGYRLHYEEVRRETPRERLLEYELGSGWGPLCEFLGKDVPEGVEFPRLNEGQSIQDMFEVMRTKAMGRVAQNLGIGAGVVAVGVGLWTRWRSR